MSDRTSLALHVALAAIVFVSLFAMSSVGDIQSFQSWLLGYSALSTRLIGLVLGVLIPALIIIRYFAGRTDEDKLRWIAGGGIAGFLVAFVAGLAVDIAPVMGLALIAAGALGGWVLAPRAAGPGTEI